MRVLGISWKGISALLSFKKTADKLLISANSMELGKAAELLWNAVLDPCPSLTAAIKVSGSS